MEENMLITDLTTETKIKIMAKIGDEIMEFDSVIDEVVPNKRIVLAAPVYKNDKLVTFRGKGLIVDILITPEDNSPQLFKNVTVNLMKKGDNTYWYNLVTQTPSKAQNRRGAFRCYVGVGSTIQIGTNRSTEEIVIKDVSTTGFSFVCSNEIDIPNDKVVHTVMNDYIAEIAENFSFQMYGIVARKQEVDEHRVLYGCRLNAQVKGLDVYIVKKERIRLMKERGSK